MTSYRNRSPKEEEEWLLKADGFIWDIVTQLYQLRERRGLSQSELAERVGTKQQAISRLENPGYDRHSLEMLRRVAKALDAFIDVIVVPEERLKEYLEWRYQPVLMDTPPGEETSGPTPYVRVSDRPEQAGEATLAGTSQITHARLKAVEEHSHPGSRTSKRRNRIG